MLRFRVQIKFRGLICRLGIQPAHPLHRPQGFEFRQGEKLRLEGIDLLPKRRSWAHFFIRYTSTEKKDLYFPIYIGSLESNLMQMVLAKEKLAMFMKGQDADMDEIYAKFGVDYDLLSTLMTRETDDEGHLRIHWGEQKIA